VNAEVGRLFNQGERSMIEQYIDLFVKQAIHDDLCVAAFCFFFAAHVAL